MTKKRILVVEDEAAIADAIEFHLRSHGFAIVTAVDGEAALQHNPDEFDLVILDLMLPKLSGQEVCRQMRSGSSVPILMLTARTGEIDRVMGLEVGADDYLGKPFSMAELLARVRAMIRRREMDRRENVAAIVVGDVYIDLVDRLATVEGRPVDLTPLEFRLLGLLAANAGRPVSRPEIVRHLWRSDHVGNGRTCDAHVKNLRIKIERDPAQPQRIITARGVGYLLRGS